MRLKLFKKYFFTTSVIIIFSFSFLMMILSFLLNSYIIKSKQQTMEKACFEVEQHIKLISSKEEGEIQQFCNVLSTVADVSDLDIFITDSDGKIFVCSCEDWMENKSCGHSVNTVYIEEKEESKDGKKLLLSGIGIYEKPHYVYYRTVNNDSGKPVCTVYATSSVSIVKELLSAVTKLYAISAIVPIILMFFCIYIITYRMTRPIKLMSEASKAMSKGDFSRRIPVMTDDEIGELSASFNMMTNSIAKQEGMRKSFIANVSHELKTPMTTIGGFVDGMLDGTVEPEKQRHYLTIVSQEVKRLSRLVQSMLSMSRLESGEFVLKRELFDISQLLCQVVISQEQNIESKQISISGLDTLESISVNADRDLIHQVIYNLVDNAVKFTNDGGRIEFGLKTENKKTVLTVTNSGNGIPEKDLPFVFDRFYKVDKSRSASKNSTGLGLYIVKTIVAAHGGQVTVSSKENECTTFKIVLI